MDGGLDREIAERYRNTLRGARQVITPLWVPYEIALAFHREQVAEHGGSPGLRSEDRLARGAWRDPSSAVKFAPSSDLFRLAAAYAFGIAKVHAFVDGNKRVAFAVGGDVPVAKRPVSRRRHPRSGASS